MTTPALPVTAPAAWWYFGPQTGKASGFSSLTVAWDPGGVRRWTVDLEISEFFLLILVGLGADGSGERPSDLPWEERFSAALHACGTCPPIGQDL